MPVDDAKSPLKIAVLGNGGKPEVVAEAGRLAGALRAAEGVELVGVDLDGETDLSGLEADVAVVLGGTGPSSTRRGGWGTRRRPCWGSTSAGSGSSPS